MPIASPSIPVLLCAFAVSLATGVAFGIAPAWMAVRVDPIDALRGAGRATARGGSLRWRYYQAALSLALLSAAGLLTAALQHLENGNLGFERDHRLVVTMNPKLAGYRPVQLSPLYRRTHDSIAGIPGVASLALCLYAPPRRRLGLRRLGRRPSRSGTGGRQLRGMRSGVGGILRRDRDPILEGRGISEADTAASRKVVVISEAFARKYFRGEDPIGKHFGRTPDATREFEVVGVAKDARYLTRSLNQRSGPVVFLPETQADKIGIGVGGQPPPLCRSRR